MQPGERGGGQRGRDEGSRGTFGVGEEEVVGAHHRLASPPPPAEDRQSPCPALTTPAFTTATVLEAMRRWTRGRFGSRSCRSGSRSFCGSTGWARTGQASPSNTGAAVIPFLFLCLPCPSLHIQHAVDLPPAMHAPAPCGSFSLPIDCRELFAGVGNVVVPI